MAEADVGWVSLSDLARALGRDKGGVSRRVSRFEAQRLINTRVGTAGQKLIRIDEYKRAVEAGGDAVQEVNGRKAGAARDGEGAPSAVLVLSRAQASKTAAQARLAQLDLAQRLGQLARRSC